jgi:hypothetical protein
LRRISHFYLPGKEPLLNQRRGELHGRSPPLLTITEL